MDKIGNNSKVSHVEAATAVLVDYNPQMPAQNLMTQPQIAELKRNQVQMTRVFKMYVGNIPNHIDEEYLKQVFSRYGEVSRVHRESRHAYVYFTTSQSMDDALDFNGAVLDNHVITCVPDAGRKAVTSSFYRLRNSGTKSSKSSGRRRKGKLGYCHVCRNHGHQTHSVCSR